MISLALRGFSTQILANSVTCNNCKVPERSDVPTRNTDPFSKRSSLTLSLFAGIDVLIQSGKQSYANFTLSTKISLALGLLSAMMAALTL